MGISAIAATLIVSVSTGAPIPDKVIDGQNRAFQRFWGVDFCWKFDELPQKGQVKKHRLPYSGYIYPDTQGGTTSMLRKYDRAAHGGRMLASSHEQWDISAFDEQVPRRGLLGSLGFTSMETPYWHGHCNGWTAATMRHAQPQRSVEVNGVVFTPSDIKGLLAEIYLYNDTLVLAGEPNRMNPGTLHAVLANWLGRGCHPLGMESDPSEEKWNYPVYAYTTTWKKHSARTVEVKLNLAYAKDSNGEYEKSELIQKAKYFHYDLTLDNAGEIVGGQFYRDSSMIDLLWIPLDPKPSGQPGNEHGNPHLDIKKVLAIWRASVPEEVRQQWYVVDPAEEDRVSETELLWGRRLRPIQDPVVEERPAVSTTWIPKERR